MKNNNKPSKPVQEIPKLICTKKADEGKNNALYTVRIPVQFMPVGVLNADFYEYRFIGILENLK